MFEDIFNFKNRSSEIIKFTGEIPTPEIKMGERLILITLMTQSNSNPSLTKLSKISGLSRKSVVDNLAKLESKKYIQRIKGGIIDGKHVNTIYYINMHKLGYQDNIKTTLTPSIIPFTHDKPIMVSVRQKKQNKRLEALRERLSEKA